jgi:hypothetical protein
MFMALLTVTIEVLYLQHHFYGSGLFQVCEDCLQLGLAGGGDEYRQGLVAPVAAIPDGDPASIEIRSMLLHNGHDPTAQFIPGVTHYFDGVIGTGKLNAWGCEIRHGS